MNMILKHFNLHNSESITNQMGAAQKQYSCPCKLTCGSSNNGWMPLESLSISQRRIEPLPAPDAARSLLLHTATEPTQECADKHKFSGLRMDFPAVMVPKDSISLEIWIIMI